MSNAAPPFIPLEKLSFVATLISVPLGLFALVLPQVKELWADEHFWARGYFCATVGQMTEEMIKEYLEHHFEPNRNDGFKMEPD